MKVFLFLIIGFVSNIALSQWTVNNVPSPKENGKSGYVSNPDQLLTREEEERVNAICRHIEKSDSFQVAFVLLNSIGSESPKEFAGQLFNKWGVGHAGRNDGLLALFVLDQRRIEFETGYGTETVMSDYECVEIQQEYMIPYFFNGAYGEGTIQGAEAIANSLSGKIIDPTKQKPTVIATPLDRVAEASDEELKQFLENVKIAKSNYISAIEHRNTIILDLSKQIENDYHQTEVKKSIIHYDFDQIDESEQTYKITLLAAAPLFMSLIQNDDELRIQISGAENRITSEKRKYEEAVAFYNASLELSNPEGNFEPIEALD